MRACSGPTSFGLFLYFGFLSTPALRRSMSFFTRSSSQVSRSAISEGLLSE